MRVSALGLSKLGIKSWESTYFQWGQFSTNPNVLKANKYSSKELIAIFSGALLAYTSPLSIFVKILLIKSLESSIGFWYKLTNDFYACSRPLWSNY